MEVILYKFHFNWPDCIWWLIPLTLSSVFIIASIGVWKSQQTSLSRRFARIIIPIMALFCVVITIVWIGFSLFGYHVIKTQINEQKYTQVNGVVENFAPMPWDGRQQETFVINGVSFSYSSFEIKPGYHTSSSWGGVITHDGQHLEIHYVGTDEYKVITYIAEITK